MDSDNIFAVALTQSVYLLNVATGAVQLLTTIEGSGNYVTSLSFCTLPGHTKYIAVGTNTHTISTVGYPNASESHGPYTDIPVGSRRWHGTNICQRLAARTHGLSVIIRNGVDDNIHAKVGTSMVLFW